jgi:NADH-quinone oxidoreductase subunit M
MPATEQNMILSFILLLPLTGAGILALIRSSSVTLVKTAGLIFSTGTFAASVWLFVALDSGNPGMQFVEKYPWINAFDTSYHLGVDGISMLLVVLTAFLTPISLLASWTSVTERVKGFVIAILLLETGTLGVFMALDLFLFYVFWEFMLIPMYFIIGIWGGEERIYAAVKFFLYTMAGSLLMLVAILVLGYYASTLPGGTFTTDLTKLSVIASGTPINMQNWLFLAFAISFFIKVPLFPFHTWLPDAHVQAPTAGSVLLAGVLLKMGTYGLVRFCLPLFPYAVMNFLPVIAVLAVIGVLYGALVSMVQPDLKKLVAYSSVSHLGFVVLGIFAVTEEGMQGAVIQMINHGLSTGALFLLVGMIYERRHTKLIADYGGLAGVMPVFASFYMIVMLSSVGLPGLNGFVGEFLILLGAFNSPFLGSSWYAVLATLGVILAAVYLLWSYQRVFFGTVTRHENRSLADLNIREIGLLIPIVILIAWIGFFPRTFLEKTALASRQIVQVVQDARRGAVISANSDVARNPERGSQATTKPPVE